MTKMWTWSPKTDRGPTTDNPGKTVAHLCIPRRVPEARANQNHLMQDPEMMAQVLENGDGPR